MTQQLRRFFLFSAVAGLAIYPLYGGEFYIQLLTKIMVMAVFAMSLDLLVGYAGLVSLGHAAFFGVAGYVAALLMPQYEAGNVWLTLPAALCAATLLALVVGALALRTSGVYFIMVTLALAQMLYYFVHDAEFAGGSDGMLIMLKPEAVIFGWKPFDLNSPAHFYYVVLAVMLGVYFLLRAVLRSSFGHALAGIKSNEHRMRSLGFPVVSLQARRLYPRRHRGRLGRLSGRAAVRLRQPGVAGLAPVGQRPDDGDPGRHG